MGNMWSQMFPPKPQFTEANVPDLEGKVYIVTGSSAGIGKELARILYMKNARVYMANRNEDKTKRAMEDIKALCALSSSTSSSCKGSMEFLKLDLGDLSTIKRTADDFLARESRLDVLFNNAGVMAVDQGRADERTRQGHEVHMGTNCLGTFLLTKLLSPVLISTAKDKKDKKEGVRVVWVSSTIDTIPSSGPQGLRMDNLDYHDGPPVAAMFRYGNSKVGNYLHAVEWPRRHADAQKQGVVSVSVNPGNLKTELYREHQGLAKWAIGMITYPIINGTYSLLYAGLSEDVVETGCFVKPFGRVSQPGDIYVKAGRPEGEQGGTGGAAKFWEWSEEQVKDFV